MLGEPVLRRHARMAADDRVVRFLVVLPERSELVRHKLERSPLLRDALEAGSWHLLKASHLRDWARRDERDDRGPRAAARPRPGRRADRRPDGAVPADGGTAPATLTLDPVRRHDDAPLLAGHPGRDQPPELVAPVGGRGHGRRERLEDAAVAERDREVASPRATHGRDDVRASGSWAAPVVDEVVAPRPGASRATKSPARDA